MIRFPTRKIIIVYRPINKTRCLVRALQHFFTHVAKKTSDIRHQSKGKWTPNVVIAIVSVMLAVQKKGRGHDDG